MLENLILIVCNIGLVELLDYGCKLKGVVLEEGLVGSYVVIVVCVLVIFLVIYVECIIFEVLNGDMILVDGDMGIVYLCFEEFVVNVFCDKMVMQVEV